MLGLSQETEDLVQMLLDETVQKYEKEISSLKSKLDNYSGSQAISHEDYHTLEMKYQKEHDEAMKLRREIEDAQSKLQASISQTQDLKNTINKQNEDMTSQVDDEKAKNEEITELKKKIAKLELSIKVQTSTLNDTQAELAESKETIRNLMIKNSELQEACQSLYEYSTKLNEAIQSATSELSAKDEKIEDLEKDIKKLKRKYNAEASSDKTELFESSATIPDASMIASTTVDNSAYNKLRKENIELRESVSALKEEEIRADRLQSIVENRNKQLSAMQSAMEENEKEITECKKTINEQQREISRLLKNLENIEKNSEDQREKLSRELDEYQKRFGGDHDKLEETQEALVKANSELLEMRVELEKLQQGEFGLADAINKLKEYKQMVLVRDKSINDLVKQVNMLDIFVNGLLNKIGKDFNIEKFIDEVELSLKNEERRRVHHASKVLNQRLQEMKENTPMGSIRIILDRRDEDSDSFDSEETTRLVGKLVSMSPRPIREADPTPVPSSVPSGSNENSSVPSPRSSSASSISSPRLNSNSNSNSNIIEDSATIVSSAHQAEQAHQAAKEDESHLEEEAENDQGQIIELTNQNKKLQNELLAAKKKVEKAKGRYSKLKESSEGRCSKLEERIAELEKNRRFEADLVLTEFPTAVDMKWTPEIVAPSRSPVFLGFVPSFFEVPYMPPKCTTHTEEIAELPTEKERRMYQQREREQKEAFQKAVSDAADFRRALDLAKEKMRNKESAIDEKQQTIRRLEAQLDEQREQFKERLREIQEESTRTTEARVRELRESISMSSERNKGDGDFAKLPEVSTYISSLKDDNERLSSRVQELEEMLSSVKRDAEEYRRRVKQLEAEKDDDDKPQRESQANMEYLKKLQRTNTDLKKRVAHLTDVNEQLKTLSTKHSEALDAREDDNESSQMIHRLTAQVQSLKAKLNTIKTENEETKKKYEKEHSQNEKMKAMVAKREETVQKLIDKYNKAKHQNEKLKDYVKRMQSEAAQ